MFGLQAIADYIKTNKTAAIVIDNIELPAHVDPKTISIFTDTFGNDYEAYVNYEIHNGNLNITFYDWILGGGTWQTVTVSPLQIEKITWKQFIIRLQEAN